LTGPGHWSLGSTLGGSTVDVPISTSTVLATRDELFSTNEQLALAGFLAAYSGLTRDAYTLDLRHYVAWCTEHRLAVFGARRADIECFARHLECRRRALTRQTRWGATTVPHDTYDATIEVDG
jgi:hypothetical protein